MAVMDSDRPRLRQAAQGGRFRYRDRERRWRAPSRLRALLGLAMAMMLLGAGAALPIASAAPFGEVEGTPQHLETTPLVIETADGRRHPFLVELADNEQERRIGLMFRHSLDARGGMLFHYLTPQRVAMWMKNTFIPLDILFIKANGRVVNIAHGKPRDLTALPSRGRVLAALELAGGTAARLGIRPGAVVHHPIFGNWTRADAALVREAFGRHEERKR